MIAGLLDWIPKLAQQRVLVVGDMAIDEMVYGHTARLSREAPVLILSHQHTDLILGGGANAAHNVAALDALTHVVGLYGPDDYGDKLQMMLARDGIQASGLTLDAARPTTTKTRISGIANQSVTQQIVRIDRESKQPVSGEVEAQVLAAIRSLAPNCDALLLSDYGLGMVTPSVIATCAEVARAHQLVWTVDAQTHLERFQGVAILTPNLPEAERTLGRALDTPERLQAGGEELLALTQARAVLITRGAEGMTLFRPGQVVFHLPAFNRSDVFDVTGAGDTVVATLTLALTAGASYEEAAVLGNLAASIVVRRFGAATTSPEELRQALLQLDSHLMDTVTEAVRETTAAPRQAASAGNFPEASAPRGSR
jgi:rfaE bifunctional protein kinase chain/domain